MPLKRDNSAPDWDSLTSSLLSCHLQTNRPEKEQKWKLWSWGYQRKVKCWRGAYFSGVPTAPIFLQTLDSPLTWQRCSEVVLSSRGFQDLLRLKSLIHAQPIAITLDPLSLPEKGRNEVERWYHFNCPCSVLVPRNHFPPTANEKGMARPANRLTYTNSRTCNFTSSVHVCVCL